MHDDQHWAKAYDLVIRGGWLRPNESVVYLNLLSHQGLNATAFPSHTTVGREVNLSPKTVQRVIKSLREKGLITVTPRCGDDGRQTTNAYRVRRVPIGGTYRPGAMVTVTNEEDSNQEASLKTSSKMMMRSWTGLSPDKPATKQQLDYIHDLIIDFEECNDVDAKQKTSALSLQNQVEADGAIKEIFQAIVYRNLFGKSNGFELLSLVKPTGVPVSLDAQPAIDGRQDKNEYQPAAGNEWSTHVV